MSSFGKKFYASLKKRALDGDVKSIYLLGRCLEEGRKGITVNLTEAFNWYAKAAEKGYSLAQKKLGEMYFYGIGVPPNIKRAHEWLSLAKSDENVAKIIKDEENKYGNILKVDFKRRQIIFGDEEMALLGDTNSLFRMGLKHFLPDENKNTDNTAAFSYFLKAAKAGHLPSQFQIAYMYETGLGVNLNEVEAFNWYKKAAENGDMDSAHNLGLMYQDGRGTKQNYTLAYKWYKEASKKGCELSCNKIGVLYFFGYGVPKDLEKSFSWYMKSAIKGYKYAEYNLGYSYFHGLGVKQNYKEAFKWFMKSAQKGHVASCEYLSRMLGFGIGATENLDEAVSFGQKAIAGGSVTAAFCLGQIYQKRKHDIKQAISYYEQAMKRGDNNSVFALASIYLFGDDNYLHSPNYENALKYFKIMVGKGENYAYEEIGDIYYNLKQYPLAFKNYETAFKLTGIDGLKGLGDMYYHGHYVKKDIDRAINCYKTYYNNHGYKAISTLKMIGDIFYYDKNEPLRALHWYLKALKYENSSYAFLKYAHARVIEIYLSYKKYEKAVKFVEIRNYLKHSDTCQYLLGNAYFSLGNFKSAFKSYLKVNSTQTKLRMNAKALISFMAKGGQGVNKNDALANKEEKYIVIESSTYAKYLIGHNFLYGINAHPVSPKNARMWLTFAAYEGSYDAIKDLAHLASINNDNVELALYKKYLDKCDKKKYKNISLTLLEKRALKARDIQLKKQISTATLLNKMQKTGVVESMKKRFKDSGYTVLENIKISGIKIDILAYSNDVIIPMITISHNPVKKEDLLIIERDTVLFNGKYTKSPFTKLDIVAEFIKNTLDIRTIPIVLSVKNMVFDQSSLVSRRKKTILRSLGEIHQDVSFENVKIADNDTTNKINKIVKRPILSKIKSMLTIKREKN